MGKAGTFFGGGGRPCARRESVAAGHTPPVDDPWNSTGAALFQRGRAKSNLKSSRPIPAPPRDTTPQNALSICVFFSFSFGTNHGGDLTLLLLAIAVVLLCAAAMSIGCWVERAEKTQRALPFCPFSPPDRQPPDLATVSTVLLLLLLPMILVIDRCRPFLFFCFEFGGREQAQKGAAHTPTQETWEIDKGRGQSITYTTEPTK